MKKIAFPTEDGVTISRHLGMAPYFMVAILDDSGKITYEKREKPHHEQGAVHHHEHGGQGMGKTMLKAIADCQVLISGGMGQPAYEKALAQGLQVYLPAEIDIKKALDADIKGELENDMRRIHRHN
jgi:predicted Fe-Mo cluster-binding NifX family protein